MKTLLAFILAVLFSFTAFSTNVQFNLTDPQFGLSQTTNRYIVVQAESGVSINGQNVLLPFKVSGYTDTNGQITFNNLFGSPIAGWYHVTVPAPPQRADFDIWVQSTNIGTVSASTIIGTFGASTYPAQAFAWSAAVADARYAFATNAQGSYVQIGQLLSTSNSIVGLFQYITNGYTGIVFSNVNAYATPSWVTNAIWALATTNGITAAQATNIAQVVYSNNTASFVTASITNGLATTNYVASITNGLVSSTVTNGLSTTNFVLAQIINATNSLASTASLNYGTNEVQTNLLAALISTNNGLTTLISATTNGLAALTVTASNALNNAKQPANGILTNLAVTGAFTNILAAGQNVTVTTNFSGNTVFVNATNQTFLTNGFTGIVFANSNTIVFTNQLVGLTNGFITAIATNGLASLVAMTNYAYPTSNPSAFVSASITNGLAGLNYVYPTSNPSAFVSASITNGFATTNWVKAGFDTNGAAAAAVAGLNFQGPSLTLSNLAGTGAWTNNIVAGQNVTLTTNFSGNTVFVNATNQSFLTNGLATLTQATNAALGFGVNSTNFTLLVGAANSNNEANLFLSATNYAVTNLFLAATNFATTNVSGFYVLTTNGTATWLSIGGGIDFGVKTNFLITTNLFGISGGAAGNGTYEGFNSVWTNVNNANYTIQLIAGTYYLNSNSTTLYSSATGQGQWSLVSGSAPAPFGATGMYRYSDGTKWVGVFYSTNLTYQITNLAYSLILQYAVNPTNGITAATCTNIVTAMTNGLATTNYVANLVGTIGTNGSIANMNGLGTNTILQGNVIIGANNSSNINTYFPNTAMLSSPILGGRYNIFDWAGVLPFNSDYNNFVILRSGPCRI